MDGLSVAAHVAGVTALGLQLSQTLYALIITVHDAGREIASVANDVSLLAAVLKELEVVFRQDYRLYRKQLVKAVLEMLNSCEGVFKGIKGNIHVSSSGHLPKKIAGYFIPERVKTLKAGLGSLKSTLSVLLHVVQLAKVSGEAQSYQAYPGAGATPDDVQREKRSLVEFLIGNRQDILQLQELEKEFENRILDDKLVRTEQQNDESVYNIIGDVAGPSIVDGTSTLSAKQPTGDTRAVDDQKSLEDKEGTQSLHPVEVSDEAAGSDDWNDWDTFKPEDYKKTTEEEKKENEESESVVRPRVHMLSSSGKHIETRSADKEDLSERIPTAHFFLGIVPHARTVPALVSRPSQNETASVQTRAEDTAKTLLLTWTGIDLDFVFEDSGDLDHGNLARGHHPRAQTEGTYSHIYSHTAAARLSQYQQPQTYTPNNTWLPQHQLYNQQEPYLTHALCYLYPHCPSCFTALRGPPDTSQQQQPTPPPPESARPLQAPFNPEQTGSSTASKITDNDIVHVMETESHNQDLAKSANDELHESGQQLDHRMKEKQLQPELQAVRKEEEVVILNDAVGRSLKLPFHSCKTKDGLEKAIKEAMLQVEEYSPLTEAGRYDIVNPDGEIILRSCWEAMVQPGWQINMVMWPMSDAVAARVRGDAETSDSSNDTDKSDIEAVAAPIASSLHKRTSDQLGDQARSAFDDDADGDDDADEEQLERALWESCLQHLQDRYMKNENLLTKQKRAKISVEVKLERNKRFVQLRQQLAEQETLLRARQEAADEAEQDAQLSWLEKQAANQKAELDALSPPLSLPFLTPPSSAKSTLSSKSDSGSQRKVSVRARLFGRGSFRSIRSKDSGKSGQLSALDETMVTSLSGIRLIDG